MTVFALIPCFNEEASIEQTINMLRDEIADIEIIVIDNGSTDLTSQKALNAGARVIQEPRRGKGFAVQAGFDLIPKNASAVFMVDGDATYGVENLRNALSLIERSKYDMVIGVRKSTESKTLDRSYRRGHRFGNLMLSSVYKLLFNIEIRDTLSGWRLMSTPFVKSFPKSAASFEIEAELNVHAYNLNAAVAEVESSYRERAEGSTSKLRTYSDGWLILKRNLSLYRSERPSLAFKLVGLPWLILSLFLVSLPISDFLKTGEVARFPSLIAGVGAFIISTNLWVTGMILERVRLQRIAQIKFRYSDFLQSL